VPTSLAVEFVGLGFFQQGDFLHDAHCLGTHQQLAFDEPTEKFRLLDRRNRQRAVQPKAVDHVSDFHVAITELLHPCPHSLESDAPSELLVDRHIGRLDRVAQIHVAFPMLKALRLSAVGQYFVRALYRAGVESDQ
jgi:hypothetical protein